MIFKYKYGSIKTGTITNLKVKVTINIRINTVKVYAQYVMTFSHSICWHLKQNTVCVFVTKKKENNVLN